MITKNQLLIIAFIGLLYSCNSGTTIGEKDPKDSSQRAEVAKDLATNPGATPQSMQQNEFAINAAMGGMMEVEAGTQMVRTTENVDVQDFAVIMVKDHLAVNAELKQLGKQLKLQLPTALPTDRKKIIDQMTVLEEYEKNRFYADLMVKEHEKAVALFAKASKEETGPLQAFATKHLTRLQHHLMDAKNLQKLMRQISDDKGDHPLDISKKRDPNQ